ncbi:hypothetical protein [Azohydromonas lata]|uniref:hypothetical protein n=1 Tax=Azohydromonas lata TaxID=45677 RepID=UPI000832DD5F|nr:hypothetical protein [Azohydromonas lata]
MSQRAQQIKDRAAQAGHRAEADEPRQHNGHSAEIARHRARAEYLAAAVDTLCREAEFAADMRKPRPAAGNRVCLAAFGAVPVALEYELGSDDNEPVALLLNVWIEGRVNSADDNDLFTPQLVARWNLVVQADYEHHLSEMARDALELAAQNAHAASLEPCPLSAAVAEDQFIAQRDAASYQRAA